MRLSFMVKYVLYFSCEKNENKQKEAGFGPFKGHQLPNDLEPLPLLKGKWSSQAQWKKIFHKFCPPVNFTDSNYPHRSSDNLSKEISSKGIALTSSIGTSLNDRTNGVLRQLAL